MAISDQQAYDLINVMKIAIFSPSMAEDDIVDSFKNTLEETLLESETPTSLTSSDFSSVLKFNEDEIISIDNSVTQSSNISFTLSNSGELNENVAGKTKFYAIEADGSSTFTFSSDFVILNDSITSGSALTASTTYLFSFLFDGSKVLVNVLETNA